LWWFFESVLSFLHIYFNSPEKPTFVLSSDSIKLVMFYAIATSISTYALGVVCKRHSICI
jgi:hypothetical protein